MSKTWRTSTVATAGLVGLLTGTGITAYARADTWRGPEAANVTGLLGTKLPALTLRSVDGNAVSLTDRLGQGPSLLIVLGASDCLSCASYELELKVLRSKLPGITPILIGSGGDEQLFRDYFRRGRLESLALLDPDRALLTSLRAASEPLVLLVDSEGRILFVDARPSSAASHFPFGRLLPLLGGALDPVPSSSKSGEPN